MNINSIKNKLLIAIIVPLFVFLVTYTLVNYSLVRGIYSSEVDAHAREAVNGYRAGIDGYFNKSGQIPVILARFMERAPDLPQKTIETTITGILEKNLDVYGSCVSFEPYKFSRRDYYAMSYACQDLTKSPAQIGVVKLDFSKYKYHEYEWYAEPKKLQSFYWTKPYYDAGCGDVIMVTGSEPFFDSRGKFAGVATVDVTLDYINRILSKISISQNSYSFALDKDGNFLYHPLYKPTFVKSQEVKTIEMKNIGKIPELAPHAADILSSRDDEVQRRDIEVGGQDFVLYHAKLRTTGWTVGIFVPAYELYSNVNLLVLIFVISLFIILLSVLIIFLASRSILNPLNRIKDITSEISEGNLHQEIEVTSHDEIGLISGHFNIMIRNFRELLGKVKEVTGTLTSSIQDLNVSSKEISATANQQAASVKEIVTTMEDSDNLSRKVSGRIDEVARIANQTKEYVENGFGIIKETLGRMEEIRQTNDETINGIRSLGERIDNIWEIVNIINGIADQTKIIAFNAELEATAAGEAGKNFQIVASEVRRLADSTVASTNEIRAKINEIQKSSDNLIFASENGTEKIKKGWDLSLNLRKVFDEILNSSEISATSADQIASSIKQQVAAFEQILLTLKQISEGIDDFVVSTKSTASASETLHDMSDELDMIISRYRI